MRALRKTKKCLNCETPLSEVYDFCPMCGQQNDDKNVSFKDLSRDLFENFFSFDTRLAHTFFPFFFKPGELTKKYTEGKRFTYANPIRLYIIISVFYFFILNLVVGNLTRDLSKAMNSSEADSLQVAIQNEMDLNVDSLKNKPLIVVTSDEDPEGQSWPLDDWQWRKFNELRDNNQVSEEALYDSLQLESKNAFAQLTVKQIIRVYKRDKELLASQAVKNLSIMMFVLIPVFALLLKLMYIRRKTLYINHLIHTIHLHTFAFFVFGLVNAIIYWFIASETQNWLMSGSFLIALLYAYLSFKRVYGQSWKKTFFKFWIASWLYVFVLLLALLGELIISFFIF